MADKQPSALLPSPEVIAQLAKAGLDPQTLSTILMEHHRSKAQYATAMGLMGGFCFLCSVGGSIYLGMQHHEKLAFTLLGVEVLAIVKQMIGSRL
jgi:hypothetical protein